MKKYVIKVMYIDNSCNYYVNDDYVSNFIDCASYYSIDNAIKLCKLLNISNRSNIVKCYIIDLFTLNWVYKYIVY